MRPMRRALLRYPMRVQSMCTTLIWSACMSVWCAAQVLHNKSAPLPYVRGKNSTVVMGYRRVHTADLVTANATRLQRKICWLMQADYCCLGYPFPTACADMSTLC